MIRDANRMKLAHSGKDIFLPVTLPKTFFFNSFFMLKRDPWLLF